LDKYLSIYNRLAEELGQTLSITIHPVESVKKEKARYHTLKLITRLVSICELQNYKLTFTLENLNLIRSRLDTEGIRPIVLGSDVDFCWDIGHEVYENNCTYSIDPYLRNKLSNVHIHDINGSDHYPFHYGRTDYSRAISFLTQTGYQGTLVVEINTDYLTGESWAEKYTDYVHQVYTLADVYESLMETQEKAI
jgi:sugar phosphate isomerase/epimerase